MVARAAVFVALFASALTVVPRDAVPPSPKSTSTAAARPDERQFADLEWTFVRIKYRAWPDRDVYYRANYGKPPWETDAPAAEQNLSRRVASATRIVVREPVVGLTLDDPKLFDYPWIYFVEPGTLHFTEQEVPILREFLLRGGTASFDDFHGPAEWSNLERELARVFPERSIVELQPPHPVFSCFYQLDSYPQVPGLGSFLTGRTWEKGGYVAHLRTIVDDAGRPMLFINWNTDMGDGWEWSNAEAYRGYVKYTAMAYRMEINEIIYSLTH
jgi:hypothetical protein